MDIEELQLTKILKCVLEYQNGMSADCCMQEISRIATGEI